MLISEEQANKLCNKIVDSLLNWPVLIHALQSGGLERKSQGVVGAAIQEFISEIEVGKYVLPEYRCVDFAVISPDVGGAYLNVDSVFEVKTNYAAQVGEIQVRLPGAVEQANEYLRLVSAQNAYVIYVVSSPFLDNIPPKVHRDSGWGYWNKPIDSAKNVVTQMISDETVRALGFYEKDHICCWLFDAST